MERARWNTELSHKKLNFVIRPTFWGHTKNGHPPFLFYISVGREVYPERRRREPSRWSQNSQRKLGLGEMFVLSADANVLNFSIAIFPIGSPQIAAI